MQLGHLRETGDRIHRKVVTELAKGSCVESKQGMGNLEGRSRRIATTRTLGIVNKHHIIFRAGIHNDDGAVRVSIGEETRPV